MVPIRARASGIRRRR